VHFYNVSGLSVGSDVVLPGLNALAGGCARPDVTIRQSPVPLTLENATASGATWQIAGPQFLLRIPDIARFLLTEGRDIVYEAEAGADEGDISIFVLGTVFGILLHQREQIVLHASAVNVNGKAVLFCGSSGAGKSTIAAALVQRGFRLVTDDVCAITITDAGGPMVHSDGRQLKLWAHSIESLDLAAQQGARVRNRLDKYYVEPSGASTEPLPLGTVYSLREARPPNAAGIERPNVVDAALLLRRTAYRPLLVNRMGQKVNYFHAATAIANAAGIFHLTRPLNFAAMPDILASLERHWLEIGLMEKAA
jgi:hypothetical protein